MQLQLQLYIEGQQVELHDNESVVLNQSLQNVRDIKKIYTDFTQTFNVPASKVNNKVFKHFYNFAIDGFDARNKKTSELHLNYEPFKKGKVKLEGVQMENNQPVNYRLTFYGDTVKLPDLIGDDKLDNLTLAIHNVSIIAVLHKVGSNTISASRGARVLSVPIFPTGTGESALDCALS